MAFDQGGAGTKWCWIEVFKDDSYKDILVKNIIYSKLHQGLTVYAYVIMNNHMHVLWQTKESKISKVISSFKRNTTKEIKNQLYQDEKYQLIHSLEKAKNRRKRNEIQLWRKFNYPVPIYTERFYNQKQHYILNNPVKAGFVDSYKEWIHCHWLELTED